MNKLKLFFIAIVVACISIIHVEAASFGMTASKNQVAPNSTFTVRVGGDCIGRVDLKVTNGSLSSSSVWVEQGYITVTVTAGASGNVTVTATPVTGFSDADANIYNPGSRSVSVKITEPNKPSTPSTTKPSGNTSTTSKKSSENELESLKVDVGSLSPKFNPSTTEYSLNLSKDTKELTIEAKAKDSKAKISGLGKINLKSGNNKITITVTAENGSKKTYLITAYVDESPEVFLDYKDGKIGIAKNLDGVEIPENFQKGEHEIDGKKITVFTNDKLTILFGINGVERDFYLFDKEKNAITNKFIPIKISNMPYYIVDKKPPYDFLIQEKIDIEKEFDCYRFESTENNYCIFSAIDAQGVYREYLYEEMEKTSQIFPEFLLTYQKETKTKDTAIVYILSGLLAVFIASTAFMFAKLKKRNKDEKNK